MRMSQLFPGTLRRAPAEAEEAGHQLLLRAGLSRPLGAGLFALYPLGLQVRRRIQEIARQSLAALGGQEVGLPAVFPAEAWQEAGRWTMRSHGVALRDRSDRLFLLPRRLEPLLTVWVQPDLTSHRQLPLWLYGFRSRFEGDMPVRASPLDARGSLLLEAFGFQPGPAALSTAAAELRQACEGLFRRCELPVRLAGAAVGLEGFPAQEFVVPEVPGREGFARCPACGDLANLQVARRAKPAPPVEELLPLEEVRTPECHTIAAVAAFLGVPESRTAKAVFFVSEDRFFFVVVRGDMEVSEAKVARLLGVEALRPAQEHEIRVVGASPGYASPIGIRREAPEAGLREVRIVVDDLIPDCANLVSGANVEDTHLRHVNYGRDYVADRVADLVAVQAGDPCPHCGGPLELFHSTVLGRVWTPGPHYSELLGASYLDAEGERHPFSLVCAEVDLDRTWAAAVQCHCDEHGIRWPLSLAPYAVYLLTIGGAVEVEEAAGSLYEELTAAGIPVLLDDRPESAGVKFADADLLGIPLRLAVSQRTLQQQGVEAKRRDQPREAVRVIPLQEVRAWVREGWDALTRETEEGGNDA